MGSLKLGQRCGLMPNLVQDVLGRDADAKPLESSNSVFLLLCRTAPDPLRGDGRHFLVDAIRVDGFVGSIRPGHHRLSTPAGSSDSKLSPVSK